MAILGHVRSLLLINPFGSSPRVPSVHLIDEDNTEEEEFEERGNGFDLDEDFVDLAIEE